jgi:hypothetical protein
MGKKGEISDMLNIVLVVGGGWSKIGTNLANSHDPTLL